VALDVDLLALLERGLDEVGHLAAGLAVEHLQVDPDGSVFPLAALFVFLAVVDGETDVGDFASVAEGFYFRIAGETADQHDFV